jgi:hypothetical protein
MSVLHVRNVSIMAVNHFQAAANTRGSCTRCLQKVNKMPHTTSAACTLFCTASSCNALLPERCPRYLQGGKQRKWCLYLYDAVLVVLLVTDEALQRSMISRLLPRARASCTRYLQCQQHACSGHTYQVEHICPCDTKHTSTYVNTSALCGMQG